MGRSTARWGTPPDDGGPPMPHRRSRDRPPGRPDKETDRCRSSSSSAPSRRRQDVGRGRALGQAVERHRGVPGPALPLARELRRRRHDLPHSADSAETIVEHSRRAGFPSTGSRRSAARSAPSPRALDPRSGEPPGACRAKIRQAPGFAGSREPEDGDVDGPGGSPHRDDADVGGRWARAVLRSAVPTSAHELDRLVPRRVADVDEPDKCFDPGGGRMLSTSRCSSSSVSWLRRPSSASVIHAIARPWRRGSSPWIGPSSARGAALSVAGPRCRRSSR